MVHWVESLPVNRVSHLEIISKGTAISLRKIEVSDLDILTNYEYSASITEAHSDLEVLTQLYTDYRLWDVLAGAAAIIENKSSNMLGTLQFFRSAPCIHGLEIGYIIHKREDRGKGYAAQALRLLSDHLFSTSTSISRQQLLIEVWNAPSWKVAEHCGFIREGILRSSGFGDTPADRFIYSRTANDYHGETNSMNRPSS